MPRKAKYITKIAGDENLIFKERRRFDCIKDMGHFYFDKIWNELGLLTREEAYNWLGESLNIPSEQTHFSKMNKDQIENAIYYCKQLLNDNRRCDLDFGIKPKTPFYIL